MDKFYGNFQQNLIQNDIYAYVEEIKILGYTIVPDILDSHELSLLRSKIDYIYKIQENQFGKTTLSIINEENMARMLLKYDDYFVKLLINPTIAEIVKSLLGEFYILGLQNAIINFPNIEHHQTSWHRDLPYQNFTISKPLAVNVLVCIDDFSEETGGTIVIPYSHKMEILPSDNFIEKHSVTVSAKAGSVVVFDSMLVHKAGYNRSKIIRRAINHCYQIPLLKQFYNYPKALNGKFSEDKFLAQLLGYTSQVPYDDIEYRKNRYAKFMQNL